MIMSIAEKRSLLDSAGGRYFSVEFLKKDKSLRKMICKHWTEEALTYGSHDVRANPQAHIEKAYVVAEQGDESRFKTVNLETLKKVVINGKTYTFE